MAAAGGTPGIAWQYGQELCRAGRPHRHRETIQPSAEPLWSEGHGDIAPGSSILPRGEDALLHGT